MFIIKYILSYLLKSDATVCFIFGTGYISWAYISRLRRRRSQSTRLYLAPVVVQDVPTQPLTAICNPLHTRLRPWQIMANKRPIVGPDSSSNSSCSLSLAGTFSFQLEEKQFSQASLILCAAEVFDWYYYYFCFCYFFFLFNHFMPIPCWFLATSCACSSYSCCVLLQITHFNLFCSAFGCFCCAFECNS